MLKAQERTSSDSDDKPEDAAEDTEEEQSANDGVEIEEAISQDADDAEKDDEKKTDESGQEQLVNKELMFS